MRLHEYDDARQNLQQSLDVAEKNDLLDVYAAKLNLGLALLADPDVLLLDEPYAGFDWDTYQKFWGLVAARRAAGRSVLIVSHFVVDEQRFDRIVAIRDGKAVPR